MTIGEYIYMPIRGCIIQATHDKQRTYGKVHSLCIDHSEISF